MTMTLNFRFAPRRWRAALLVGAVGAGAACSDILDVENPNNVLEESLDPTSASQQATGVLASLVRALAVIQAPYATATDELDWIGSREGWRQLDEGVLANPGNEFTDASFPWIAEARFHGDTTIKRLEAFRAENQLPSTVPLVNAYLYTAHVYATIGDVFDDFVIRSAGRQAAPAVGEANMVAVYDTAVAYLDRALALAGTNEELRYNIIASRARTKHARAVWRLLNPKGRVPANPLVNDAGANDDARTALGLGAANREFRVAAPTDNISLGLHVFFEVNGRNEMRVGTVYTNLRDPISNTPDASLARFVADFRTSPQLGNIYLVTNRELRLILAEAALAANNTTEFTTQINALRALDAKPPFSGQIPALQMLRHERQANLWMQRRRLSDMYRFGDRATQWRNDTNFESSNSTVGLFFPIPVIERLANPCLSDGGGANC